MNEEDENADIENEMQDILEFADKVTQGEFDLRMEKFKKLEAAKQSHMTAINIWIDRTTMERIRYLKPEQLAYIFSKALFCYARHFDWYFQQLEPAEQWRLMEFLDNREEDPDQVAKYFNELQDHGLMTVFENIREPVLVKVTMAPFAYIALCRCKMWVQWRQDIRTTEDYHEWEGALQNTLASLFYTQIRLQTRHVPFWKLRTGIAIPNATPVKFTPKLS